MGTTTTDPTAEPGPWPSPAHPLAEPWLLEERHRTVAGDVRWARLGDVDADPVVLLHGTPFSSAVWRQVARALARRHLVYVWDMPGYGASERFEGQDLSLDTLEQVFADLLEHWQLAAPAVVAHDSGGALALGAHLRRGIPYRRLALVDAVCLRPWGSPFSHLVGEHAAVFERLPPAFHEALIREYVATASGEGLHPSTLADLVAPWLGDGRRSFYHQLVQRGHDPAYIARIEDGYASIDLPVLLCWGSEDTWVPAARGRELATRIPDARLETFHGGGHLLPEDRPAELTAALLDFLQPALGAIR